MCRQVTRVLLIGGAGYLGGELTRGLEDGEHEVVVASRSGSDPAVDITDAQSIVAALGNIRPDVVLNLAAAGVDATRREHDALRAMIGVNAVGPSLLAREISRVDSGVRLIHFASSREALEGPVDEGRSTYSVTKSCGTAIMAEAIGAGRLSGMILRLHSVYGGSQPNTRFIASVIDAALQGERFMVREPHASLDFVHVDDVVRAVRSAIGCTPADNRALDIGTGVSTCVMATARAIYAAVGAIPSAVVEDQAWGDVGVAYTIGCDVLPASEALGWSAQIPLERGVEQAVKEYQCTGW
jgi:nucleoside-diphosphate-sugar epimerase